MASLAGEGRSKRGAGGLTDDGVLPPPAAENEQAKAVLRKTKGDLAALKSEVLQIAEEVATGASARLAGRLAVTRADGVLRALRPRLHVPVGRHAGGRAAEEGGSRDGARARAPAGDLPAVRGTSARSPRCRAPPAADESLPLHAQRITVDEANQVLDDQIQELQDLAETMDDQTKAVDDTKRDIGRLVKEVRLSPARSALRCLRR